MIDRKDLEALLAHEGAPAVSIFLPTHRAGREIRQDPIRLKNLLGAAEARLAERMRRTEAESLLAPAAALIEDAVFWRHQEGGLALFLAPGAFHCLKAPLPFPEHLAVGRRFHVRPLLPLFAADGLYHVVAVSAGRVRLFDGTRYELAERAIAAPAGVAALAEESDYQDMQHASPVGRPRTAAPVGVPKTHNFGESPEELRKTQLLEYLRRAGDAVEAALKDSHAPAVLAGDPENAGHFRKLARLPGLIEAGLDTNPDALEDGELHRRAYALVEPLLLERRRRAVERFAALAGDGSGKAATGLEAILPAAEAGRIDTLLLAEGAEEDAEERLEAAVARTLLQGGAVHVLPPEAMPAPVPAAAILRY